jgi:toxin-antitoxin system PIN domain toxin
VILVDLNLLVYAINADAPSHRRARAWWEKTLSGDDPVALAWPVVLGFLRLTTRAGLFPRPMSATRALRVMGEWIEQPPVVLVHPGEGHWKLLRELLEQTGSAGNLTTDAHLAALAIEYGATLCSTDHDFARFAPRLTFSNPIA